MPLVIKANQMAVGSMHSNQSQSNQVLRFLEKCQAMDESSRIVTIEYRNSAAMKYSGCGVNEMYRIQMLSFRSSILLKL